MRNKLGKAEQSAAIKNAARSLGEFDGTAEQMAVKLIEIKKEFYSEGTPLRQMIVTVSRHISYFWGWRCHAMQVLNDAERIAFQMLKNEKQANSFQESEIIG